MKTLNRPTPIHVFHRDHEEWIVAESAGDAAELYHNFTLMPIGECYGWARLPNDKLCSFYVNEDDELDERGGQDVTLREKTAEERCKTFKRGDYASTEC